MYLLGIGFMILAIILSVAIHELGHLLPAKKFGVYVPEYMIGFGPKLWSVKKGDTEYGVKAILLGGYVRLIGMFAPAKPGTRTHKKNGQLTIAEEARQQSAAEIPEGREHQAFYLLKTWQKLIVMFGGPFTNLVLAALLMCVSVIGIGLPQPVPVVDQVMTCVGTLDTNCDAKHPASPASAAGLQAGDRVIELAGQPIEKFSDLGQVLQTVRGDIPVDSQAPSVEIKFLRNGTEQTAQITPALYENQLKLGISGRVERVSGSLSDVGNLLWSGTKQTLRILTVLPQRVWETGRGLFTHEPRDPNSVLSIVGVTRIAGDVAATPTPENPVYEVDLLDRVGMLLSLWASLNLALFIFNLIPLPPLDGGHIAGAVFEGGRRQFYRLLRRPDPGPADTAKLMPVAQFMVGVLALMSLVLIAADIFNPIRLG